jgi:hypothetical protein
MPNWVDQQIQKQRFEDMARVTQHDYLVKQALAARSRRPRFYRPILARLGYWLEGWGQSLQERYGAIPEVAIATESPGNPSGC